MAFESADENQRPVSAKVVVSGGFGVGTTGPIAAGGVSGTVVVGVVVVVGAGAGTDDVGAGDDVAAGADTGVGGGVV